MPTVGELCRVFEGLARGSSESFFRHVADDVDWTVMGTHPLAGRYRTKEAYRAARFDRLVSLMCEGLRLDVEHVLVDGTWAVVELRSDATTKTGERFENRVCWVIRFDRKGLVAQVREYLDSELVNRVFEASREK
jgi:ketosteroid isomerase-like protein